jgi:hypothetical protein
MKKRRANGIQGMLAAILFKILSSHFFFNKLKIKIYETIILPVVLYGCETWSVTLRKQTEGV